MDSVNHQVSKTRWLLPVLLSGLLLLLAWQPLLRGQVPWRGDGLLHFYRLAQLERAVHSGIFYPRWSPDLGYGYGFPLFNYYAPFSYLVSLPLRLSGLTLATSLQLSYALALLVLGVGAYLWAQALWHNRIAGATAVLATIYTPYILYNTYHRAALAELWGLAWLVMTLWAVHKTVGKQQSASPNSQALLSVTICYALLLLSHNITALIGTPLIIGYALFLLWQKRHRRQAFTNSFTLLSASFLLGLGLSAFFWLPAFFERNEVQIENLTDSANFTYANHFLSPAELLSWPQTADPTQVNPAIPRSLSWPVIILALFAWLPLKKNGNARSFNQYRLVLTSVVLGCLFMTLPISQPVWDAIPLLAFVQFPWRFLGPATISLALLAALGTIQLSLPLQSKSNWQFAARFTKSGYSSTLFSISASLSIVLFSLPWLFPSPPPTLPTQITPIDTIRFEAETGWLGTTAAADYLPHTVTELPAANSLIARYEAVPSNGYISRLDPSLLPASFTFDDYREQFTRTFFHYQSQEPVTAVFAWYAFPGWQATLDGEPLETGIQEPHGLVTAVLPAGSHSFQLAFGSTPLRTFANTLSRISLGGLLVVAGLSLWQPRRQINRPQVRQQMAAQQKVTLAISLSVLLLLALKTFWLDQADTIFRQAAFNGQQITGVNTTARVNFGDELLLLGIDWPQQPIPADQPVNLTLFWQALPPVQAEYSVSVQMIATNGRRYGQGDSFHPAGLPVTRWQANEYGRDPHTLDMLPGTPPGAYQLVTFVYNTATGQRLDILNEAGLPMNNQYILGTLTIAAPRNYPDPATLTIGQRTTEAGTSPILAPGVQLLGFDQPLSAPTVGDILPLTLYWYTPQTPAHDYQTVVSVSCADQGVVTRSSVDDHFTPNTNWQVGQVQRADYDLPLLPLAENGRPLTNTLCTLLLELTAVEETTSIALETIPVTAPGHTFDLPASVNPIGQGLADLMALAAYDLDQTTLAPGDSLSLALYWQPEQVLETSYTVFVQILGTDGRILTQQDRLPADGARPTTGWIPGEMVHDDYILTIPPDALPGAYQIIVGMYDGRSGSRLPRQDQTGDAITLPASIEVKTTE